MPSRWRAFGIGFVLAALLGSLVGTLEARLAATGMDLGDLVHAIDLHLVLLLVVVLLVRLIAWKADAGRFVFLALAAAGALEGGTALAYRIASVDHFPSFAQPSGKLAAAGVVALGLIVGLIPAVLLRRVSKAISWDRLARSAFATTGLVLAIATTLLNIGFLWRARSHEPRVQIHPGAETLAHPDVIVILVDALRRDHVSFFGYDRPTTPNIDAFMRESRVFTNAWTASVSTVPSVASLFTGLYPSSHRVYTALSRLPDDAPLLAEHFRSYGYRTGAFVANQTLAGSNGYSRGFQTFVPAPPPWWCREQRLAFERIATRLRRPAYSHVGWELNRRMLAWMKKYKGRPRFAYIHYLEPHAPYDAPASDREAVAPGAPPGPRNPPMFQDYRAPGDGDCHDWGCLSRLPQVSDSDREGMIANYDADIHEADRRVGALLDQLRASGELDRAHVIFCNDHGEQFGDHSGWSHAEGIHEELIGCPLAWRPPGGVPGGQIIAAPISILDLLRTLCLHAGLDAPPMHQGRELPREWFADGRNDDLGGITAAAGQHLRDTTSGDRDASGSTASVRTDGSSPVLAESPPHLFALRQRDWKIIQSGPLSDPNWELFDLRSDPGERTNLAAMVPDTLAALRGLLQGTIAQLNQSTLSDVETIADPEVIEGMRSLGYIK
ncbi:MAG: sulfatase [Candidatus Eisenbacteria bacterium]|nr:sulfatase [Candidatus Eisenbacteria bacterium]